MDATHSKTTIRNRVRSVREFGVRGDDSDETAAITRAFAASVGQTLEFEEGKTYRVAGGISPGAGTTVKQNGSTLNLVSVDDQKCIDVPTGLTWLGGGGTVRNIGSGTISHGGYQSNFVFGDYPTGTSVHSVNIQDVTFENSLLGSNGIAVVSGSHDITLSGLSFPDSATLTIPILIHWGGADSSVYTTTGTTHPHNIAIRNISTGDLSRTDGGGAVVFLSACYDIAIENIHCGDIQCQHGIIAVFAGDIGAYYAAANVKPLVMTNIHARNLSALSTSRGALVECRSTLDPAPSIYPGPTIENLSIASVDDAESGMVIGNCIGTRVVNPNITGGLVGIGTGEGVDRLLISGGEIKDAQVYGINLSSTPLPINTEVNGTRVCNCGLDSGSNSTAQIRVNAERAKIINCELGLAVGESAVRGVRIESTAIDCDLIGNHCYGTDGGAAFSIGGATDYGVIKTCHGNTSDVDPLYDGVAPMPYSQIGLGSSTLRRLIGEAAPTDGAWNRGDSIDFLTLYEGGYAGAKCVIAGTPGLWRGFGAISQPTITNEFQFTEEIDNPVWNKSRCAITADAGTAPDAASTLDTAIANTTSSNGMHVNQPGMTVVSGLAYTVSCYLEPDSDDWGAIVVTDGTNGVRQWFDVTNGTTGSSNTFGTGWEKVTASIEAWGNGYRCSLSFSVVGTSLSVSIYPAVPGDLDFDCTDAVTQGHVWGAQLDRGITALTYRPRTT